MQMTLFHSIIYIFFIHSSVSGHLGCFHVLAIVNSTAVNTGLPGSFHTMFSRYMPRSGIAGSYGRFPSGSVVKSPPAVKKWQETWVQWHGSPFQYSCLENTMDRGAWRAIVHGVAKSWTKLSDFHFHYGEQYGGALKN